MKSSQSPVITTMDSTTELIKIFLERKTSYNAITELGILQLPAIIHHSQQGVDFSYRDQETGKNLAEIMFSQAALRKCDGNLMNHVFRAASRADILKHNILQQAVAGNHISVIEEILRHHPGLVQESGILMQDSIMQQTNATVKALLKGDELPQDIAQLYVDCAGFKGQQREEIIQQIQQKDYFAWCNNLIAECNKNHEVIPMFPMDRNESHIGLIQKADQLVAQIFPDNYPEFMNYAIKNKLLNLFQLELLICNFKYKFFPSVNFANQSCLKQDYQANWDKKYWTKFLHVVANILEAKGDITSNITAKLVLERYSIIGFFDPSRAIIKSVAKKLNPHKGKPCSLESEELEKIFTQAYHEVEQAYNMYYYRDGQYVQAAQAQIMLVNDTIPLLKYFLGIGLDDVTPLHAMVLKVAYQIAMGDLEASNEKVRQFEKNYEEYCSLPAYQLSLNEFTLFRMNHPEIDVPSKILSSFNLLREEYLQKTRVPMSNKEKLEIKAKLQKTLQLCYESMNVFMQYSKIFNNSTIKSLEETKIALLFLIFFIGDNESSIILLGSKTNDDVANADKLEEAKGDQAGISDTIEISEQLDKLCPQKELLGESDYPE